MLTTSVTISPKLRELLDGKLTAELAERIVGDSTDEMRNLIRRNVPVRTGRLKRSVKRRFAGRGFNRKGRINIDAPYAEFVNSGTRHFRGRRFVERSERELRRKLPRIARNAARDIL